MGILFGLVIVFIWLFVLVKGIGYDSEHLTYGVYIVLYTYTYIIIYYYYYTYMYTYYYILLYSTLLLNSSNPLPYLLILISIYKRNPSIPSQYSHLNQSFQSSLLPQPHLLFILYVSVLSHAHLYSQHQSRIFWPRMFYRSGWLRCDVFKCMFWAGV